MNKDEALALHYEVNKAWDHIVLLYKQSESGTKPEKQLYKLCGKCADLYSACAEEFNQELYGNLSTYRDQADALVAEATKIDTGLGREG